MKAFKNKLIKLLISINIESSIDRVLSYNHAKLIEMSLFTVNI